MEHIAISEIIRAKMSERLMDTTTVQGDIANSFKTWFLGLVPPPAQPEAEGGEGGAPSE
ncbi:MAG: hypothetical protein Pg6A_19980 [Termitinemataceae bacterium]|nr:MAG: hypothetical protein Pg6A_19980 [Termitinemataceae bacterium]